MYALAAVTKSSQKYPGPGHNRLLILHGRRLCRPPGVAHRLGAAGSNDLTPASACLILGKHKVAGGSMPRLWLPCEHAMASCLPWMKLMPPWYAGTEELGLQRHWEYLTRYWLTACAD
eukprot:scaffold87024_cov17-Tisochrysis_lutea.AAC.1